MDHILLICVFDDIFIIPTRVMEPSYIFNLIKSFIMCNFV